MPKKIVCEWCKEGERWQQVTFKGEKKLIDENGLSFAELRNGMTGWICKRCFNAHALIPRE